MCEAGNAHCFSNSGVNHGLWPHLKCFWSSKPKSLAGKVSFGVALEEIKINLLYLF